MGIGGRIVQVIANVFAIDPRNHLSLCGRIAPSHLGLRVVANLFSFQAEMLSIRVWRWVMTGYHPGSLEYAFAGFLDAHPFVRILICGLAVGALVFSMLTARDW